MKFSPIAFAIYRQYGKMRYVPNQISWPNYLKAGGPARHIGRG